MLWEYESLFLVMLFQFHEMYVWLQQNILYIYDVNNTYLMILCVKRNSSPILLSVCTCASMV